MEIHKLDHNSIFQIKKEKTTIPAVESKIIMNKILNIVALINLYII